MSSGAAVSGGSDEADPRRWKALTVTLVAGFMSLLDVSIVSVALPSIQRSMDASPAEIQWVVSGYALAFGLSLVAAGRLGDAIGRRRMFLVALAAFVVCSGLVGIAPTIGLLIAARLAQGLAAGSLAPQNTALIQQLFRGAERGRAFGFFGATVGISTAVGPVVGGLILALAGEGEGWRWIFFVNLPIGIVALVLASRLIPGIGSGRRGHLDVLGALLLGAGVLALMFPLVQAESGGLRTLWWLFVVGAVLLVVFVRFERHVVASGREPLLDVRLFTDTSGYASGALLGTVYFIAFSGVWIVFALFLQNGLGYTPLRSGLTVTSFAVGSAVSSAIGGRLVARLGRRLTVIGLSLMVVGLVGVALVVAFVPPEAVGYVLLAPLLVAGVGGGWVISPNTTMTLRNVPVRMAGSAGGALQTGQRIGSAVGTAGLAGLFYTVLAGTGGDQQLAAGVTFGVAAAAVAVAWGIAVAEWRRERNRAAGVGGPEEGAPDDVPHSDAHVHP